VPFLSSIAAVQFEFAFFAPHHPHTTIRSCALFVGAGTAIIVGLGLDVHAHVFDRDSTPTYACSLKLKQVAIATRLMPHASSRARAQLAPALFIS